MVESSRITASNIAKQSFWNLYNLINDRSNVPDPNDTSGTRKFVYAARPPHIGREFKGFPFVVVSRSKPRKGKNTVSLTRKFSNFDFSVLVYSQDKDSDSLGNANGAETADQITNNIIQTLDNPTNKKTMIGYGMANMMYDVETDEDDFNGKTVFMSEFDIRFENNLTPTQ